ncbi:MAG: hypothetical protein JNK49_01340 [Planctomycetes bacterium]|nr:hypothetical protein [Planctomycetota bacterium]
MKSIEDALGKLKTVLVGFVRLLHYVRRHWIAVSIFVVIVCSAAALHWLGFHAPGSVIRDFFHSLSQEKFAQAWEALDPAFRQKRWKAGAASFAEDYASSVLQQVERVTRKDLEPWQLWEALTKESAVYEVEVIAEDRFDKDVLRGTSQAWNERWLRIRHPVTDVDAIMRGENTSDGSTSLSLKRRFVFEIKVAWADESNSWRVSSTRWQEVSVIWSSKS